MKTKSLLLAAALSLLMTGPAATGPRQKRQQVELKNAADSALCRSTELAVKALNRGPGGLFDRFRNPETRAKEAVDVEGLSFYPLQLKALATVDAAQTKRSIETDYYRVDIDNSPPAEMISMVSGGFGPAGEGDTLYVLKDDLAAAEQPIAHERLLDVTFEIGTRTLRFYNQEFDANFFSYPFVFAGRNYLLLVGNGDKVRKTAVAELVPGTGIVTHCYF